MYTDTHHLAEQLYLAILMSDDVDSRPTNEKIVVKFRGEAKKNKIKKNEKKRRAIFIDDKAFDDRHCILCCCPYVHGQKIQLDPNDRMRTGEGG